MLSGEYDHRWKYRDRKGNRQGVFLPWDIAVKRSNLFVQELLKHNAKVYLAARNATKANAAIAELEDETRTGKDAIFLQLDLADLTAVRKSAEEFLSCVLCLYASIEFLLTILSGRKVSYTFLSMIRKWLYSVQGHRARASKTNEMAWTAAA
jgi:NAD(P)-dependent dehydrogenase (short-subunit alcohol dehydrogenase family)